MPSPTLMLVMDRIESVETDIEAIDLHIETIRETRANGNLSSDVALLRALQDQYQTLLVGLKTAADTLKG
jgi:hypothetical protein